MDPLLAVLLLVALPAAGTLGGGLFAERVSLSRRGLSRVLHVAAGGILAVSAVEILPRALSDLPAWLGLSLFLAGGVVFILLDWATDLAGHLAGESEEGGWLLFVGIAFDLFTDGLMIGAGASLDLALGLVLGLGLLVVDAAETFASFATLRQHGAGSRALRLSLLAGLAALMVAAALAGFWWLRDGPDAVSVGILAVTGGMLLTLVVEEVAPRAHGGGRGRLNVALLLAGFAAFGFLSVAFG